MDSPAKIEPGEVLWSACNGRKKRPWVVVWVNDIARTCLLIAITSKKHFCGAVPTGATDQRYAYAAAWAVVWPVDILRRDATAGGYTFSEARARSLEHSVASSLGFQTKD